MQDFGGFGFWARFPKFGDFKLNFIDDSTYYRDSAGVSIQVRFTLLEKVGTSFYYKVLGVIIDGRNVSASDSSRIYAYQTGQSLPQDVRDALSFAASGVHH